jgi:hypothetical protein
MFQVSREAVFGANEGNRFAQCAANVAQLHVLAGLDAEQHLRDKLRQRLGQLATQLGGKLRQPSFQSGADFAIVHRGRLRQTDFLGGKSLLPRIAPLPLSCRDNLLMQSPLRNATVKIWGKSWKLKDK